MEPRSTRGTRSTSPVEADLRRRLRALLLARHAAAEIPPATSDPLELLAWRVAQLEGQLAALRAEQARIWWGLLAALLIGAVLRILV